MFFVIGPFQNSYWFSRSPKTGCVRPTWLVSFLSLWQRLSCALCNQLRSKYVAAGQQRVAFELYLLAFELRSFGC